MELHNSMEPAYLLDLKLSALPSFLLCCESVISMTIVVVITMSFEWASIKSDENISFADVGTKSSVPNTSHM